MGLQLTGHTQDLPNPTRILYWPSQTFRMILVPLLLGSSDVATAVTFTTPYLICVEMPQIMEYSNYVDMG